MLDREDADDRPILGSHHEGLPPPATGAYVGLGENDQRDGLMIGIEWELLVPQMYLEGLSPVTGVDRFESHIVHAHSHYACEPSAAYWNPSHRIKRYMSTSVRPLRTRSETGTLLTGR